MFSHLLVPLDGSQLAESALPAAEYIAQTLKIPVTLVHIIEKDPPQAIHGEAHLSSEPEAKTYLDRIARTFPAGTEVDTHIHTRAVKDVAQSIVSHVDELESDLIVMCTHGSGGLRHMLFGNIAQQVINLGKTPVLLIQPRESQVPPEFKCQRMLVPLDGDPEHEHGLLIAAGLAQACNASIHLIMVVATLGTISGKRSATARFLPGATALLLDFTQEGGLGYLKNHETRLQVDGLAVSGNVQRGDPAKVIEQTAKETRADLIVMGTHGKTHMDAFWSGSVTPQVSRSTRLPLLLVPV
jgi:nucleotide-binding universal stress UspA family protein